MFLSYSPAGKIPPPLWLCRFTFLSPPSLRFFAARLALRKTCARAVVGAEAPRHNYKTLALSLAQLLPCVQVPHPKHKKIIFQR